MATPNIPLWEVFIRSRNGLAHKHCGSLHAADATMALQAARDIYTRRGEGLSIWVVPSNAITASDPSEKGITFYAKDLSNDDEPIQVAQIAHKVISGTRGTAPSARRIAISRWRCATE